ncbi:hypothetical protein M3B46_10380 [Sphingobacterium daejeonense]|uniref:hypothetical protein n=1 Tax=Sphingobacterium daejeonense TaxID=371142 RepID=UPI0021A395B2|nr:hypothetical protein [Sphingobacterium daejeonense]MCT1531402.1 hypothetical protein [Sphingobacterium daejeonense]
MSNLELPNKKLRKIIEDFRNSQDTSLLDSFKTEIKPTPDGKWSYDVNAWNRALLILELFNESSINDKPLIKWLLDEEIKTQEYELSYYALDVNAFLLYKYMDFEDVYQLFDAKFSYGNVYHLDVELIFGHDKEEMKDFLKSEKENQLAPMVFDTILSYENNPDAKFKSKDEYIAYYQNRKIKHIMNDLEASEKYMRTGKN